MRKIHTPRGFEYSSILTAIRARPSHIDRVWNDNHGRTHRLRSRDDAFFAVPEVIERYFVPMEPSE